VRALGIDVSEQRGLDLVLLDDADGDAGAPPARLQALPRHHRHPAEIADSLAEWRPDVVAIDSPPAWGIRGASRSCERELKRLGIQAFYTPHADDSGRPFHRWMAVGIEAHRVCNQGGFARYQGGVVRGRTLEVFPHASAVTLAGCLPKASRTRRDKLAFREPMLARHGIESRAWRSLDFVDAALAALTGLMALRGAFSAVGDPEEGVIVVPVQPLPGAAYRVCAGRAVAVSQLSLPGEAPCQCDPRCPERTSHRFAPGHDAKLKSRLWRQVREGEEALARLKQLGWERPAKLRTR
jgi:predicted nuclease with RNAse H fold